jgi:hypothetical protein
VLLRLRLSFGFKEIIRIKRNFKIKLNDKINESIVQIYLLIAGHKSFETFPFLAEYPGTEHKTTVKSNTRNRKFQVWGVEQPLFPDIGLC